MSGWIGPGFVEYALVLPHSCDLDKPTVGFISVATAWRASTLKDLLESSVLDLVLANRMLDKFSLRAPQISGDEFLVVDLRQITTLLKSSVVSRIKWSLDDEEIEALQAALVKFFALRDITRERSLREFEGRRVISIRTIRESPEQSRVEILFSDSSDVLNLWLYPRKTLTPRGNSDSRSDVFTDYLCLTRPPQSRHLSR